MNDKDKSEIIFDPTTKLKDEILGMETISKSELSDFLIDYCKGCNNLTNDPNWMLQPFIKVGACSLTQALSEKYNLQIDVKELMKGDTKDGC